MLPAIVLDCKVLKRKSADAMLLMCATNVFFLFRTSPGQKPVAISSFGDRIPEIAENIEFSRKQVHLLHSINYAKFVIIDSSG